jgi:hypothetical protein
MVHSVLEILPLAVICVVTMDLAISGGVSAGGWSPVLRDDLRIAPLATGAAVVLVLNVLPLLEEHLRCRVRGPAYP